MPCGPQSCTLASAIRLLSDISVFCFLVQRPTHSTFSSTKHSMKTPSILFVPLSAIGAFAISGPNPIQTYPSLASCVHQPSFFSCENITAIENTCCSPAPGGLVLATQFWSTYTGLERKGQKLPKGSWTLHGLWPDNCDGYATPIQLDLSKHLGDSVGPSNSIVIFQDSTTPFLPLQSSPTAPLSLRIRGLVLIPSLRNLERTNYWITVRPHITVNNYCVSLIA